MRRGRHFGQGAVSLYNTALRPKEGCIHERSPDLAGKPSSAVETIAEGQLVAQAAAKLAERRIGALIVTPESGAAGEFSGILSERDIVRTLAQQGSGCLDWRVGDLMTRDVICAAPSDSMDSVLATMTERRFRHMPVVEDGVLVGVISIGDAVKARIDGLERENAALADWIKSG